MSAISQETTNQIALIGVTQSGKTTLAAGLAKSSDKDFAVGFADDTTREYLGGVIARIDGGDWPAGTGGENIDLAITINLKGGRSTAVAFKEYKGEKFSDPTYVQKIVGTPSGALILLNPGMEILQSASGRSKMLVNMKRIIDHLKSVSCTAIALVVTAHDRLSTDLAEFKPQFDEYLSEVENYLCTKKILWKRFEVTITGPLADQAAPTFAKGAENTARAPFVWLMDRIEAKRRRTKLMKRLKGCALVAVILAVVTAPGFGWKRWQVEKEFDKYEKDFDAAVKEYDLARKAHRDVESGMNTALVKMDEIVHKIEDKRFWFGRTESRRTNFLVQAKTVCDQKIFAFIKWEINDCKNGKSEDDWRLKVDNRLERFNPLNKELKTELRKLRSTNCLPSLQLYDQQFIGALQSELDLVQSGKDVEKGRKKIVEICKKINGWKVTERYSSEKTNLLGKANERLDALQCLELKSDIDRKEEKLEKDKLMRVEIVELGNQIAIWQPLTDYGNQKKKQLEEGFNGKSNVWYQKIADRECNKAADGVCKSLSPECLGFDDSNAIRTALDNVVAFLQSHTNASPNVRRDASNRVCRAQVDFLERFAEKYTSRWMPNAPKRPALSEQNEKFIIEALDVVDITNCRERISTRFLTDVEQKRKDAESTWSTEQQRICEQFVKENLIEGRPEKELFEDYAEWYAKWYRGDSPDSPHVENVNRSVELVVSDFFDRYIEKVRKPSFIEGCKGRNSIGERRNARKEFDNFSDLCMKINSKKRGNLCGIANSWCADFASACYNAGLKHKKNIGTAFQQVLTITQVEVMVSEDSVYNDYKGAKFGLWLTGYDWKNEEFNEVVHEDWLKGEWCSDYVATTKNVYHTIWSNPKKIYVNPWTCFTLNFWGTVSDGSGTDAVKPDEVEAIIRLRPMDNTERAEHVLNYSFKCKKREKSYTCSCKIHCTFEGPYLFGLYEKCRNGGVVK